MPKIMNTIVIGDGYVVLRYSQEKGGVDLLKKRVFRDPIHNMIEFDEDQKEEKLLVDLISSKEVQRLRYIRQLGFSFLTFPGAEHSRFVHTLGVTHLIKRIFMRLKELREELKAQEIIEPDGLDELYPVAMSAAILHDIGHGPFSHVAERNKSGKKHEDWSVGIIKDCTTEVNQVLVNYDRSLPDKIKGILKRTFRPSFLVKILSSQLDADRMDYLLRDSLMTGTGYGKYDLNWLLNVLRVGVVNSEQEIGINAKKGRLITENFIMARYSMYLQVYFHKTTRGGEVLLDKILQRAGDLLKEGQEIPIHPTLDKINKEKLISVSDYLELNDNIIFSLIAQWAKSGDKILEDLCNRLMRRKLLKSIDLQQGKGNLIEFAEKYNEAKKIIKRKGFLPEYYLAHDEAENYPYKDYYIIPSTAKTEEAQEASLQIYLFDDNFEAEEISNNSDIIRAIRNREYTLERIYFPEEVQKEMKGIF